MTANTDNWIQLGILVFGCTGIFLLGIPDSWSRWKALKRYGPILGLLSQPFWYAYGLRTRGSWGISGLNVAYTLSWFIGFWLNWIAPRFSRGGTK